MEKSELWAVLTNDVEYIVWCAVLTPITAVVVYALWSCFLIARKRLKELSTDTRPDFWVSERWPQWNDKSLLTKVNGHAVIEFVHIDTNKPVLIYIPRFSADPDYFDERLAFYGNGHLVGRGNYTAQALTRLMDHHGIGHKNFWMMMDKKKSDERDERRERLAKKRLARVHGQSYKE